MGREDGENWVEGREEEKLCSMWFFGEDDVSGSDWNHKIIIIFEKEYVEVNW